MLHCRRYACPANYNPADHLFMSVLNAGSRSDTDASLDFVAGLVEDEESRLKVRGRAGGRAAGGAAGRGGRVARKRVVETATAVGAHNLPLRCQMSV